MTVWWYWALVAVAIVVGRGIRVAMRNESARTARLERLTYDRQLRVAEDHYWANDRLEVLRAAMMLTVDRYEPMVRELLATNRERSLQVVS